MAEQLPKWADVSASPEFQAADSATREAMRMGYREKLAELSYLAGGDDAGVKQHLDGFDKFSKPGVFQRIADRVTGRPTAASAAAMGLSGASEVAAPTAQEIAVASSPSMRMASSGLGRRTAQPSLMVGKFDAQADAAGAGQVAPFSKIGLAAIRDDVAANGINAGDRAITDPTSAVGRARKLAAQGLLGPQVRSPEQMGAEQKPEEQSWLGNAVDANKLLARGVAQGTGSIARAAVEVPGRIGDWYDSKTAYLGALLTGETPEQATLIADKLKASREGMRRDVIDPLAEKGGKILDYLLPIAESTKKETESDIFEGNPLKGEAPTLKQDASLHRVVMKMYQTLGQMAPIVLGGVVVGGAKGMAAGGALGFAQAADEGGSEESKRIRDLPAAAMREIPLYKQYRTEGLSHEEAVLATSADAGRAASLVQGMLGSLDGLLFPGAGAAARKSIAKVALKDGAVQGMQEAAESAGSRTAASLAVGEKLDPERIGKGLYDDAALGAVTGKVIGGSQAAGSNAALKAEEQASAKFDASIKQGITDKVASTFGRPTPVTDGITGAPETKATSGSRSSTPVIQKNASVIQDEPVSADVLLGARPKSPVDIAAHEAATSPLNDKPEPTQAQKEAGTYAKGHTKIAGLDIAIENPQGSIRKGVDADGKAWENTLSDHYGYVKGTIGNDKDAVDTFIKAGTQPSHSGPVFVVDQVDPKTGKLDEHKAIIGAANEAEARTIYQRNYAKDWNGLGAITQLPIAAFKSWVKDGAKREPLGDITGWKAEPKAIASAPAKDTSLKATATLAQAIRKFGGLPEKFARDLTGEPALTANKMPGYRGLFHASGTDLSTLVHDGKLDAYLPPNLRSDVRDDSRPTDTDAAVAHIEAILRNGEAQTAKSYARTEAKQQRLTAAAQKQQVVAPVQRGDTQAAADAISEAEYEHYKQTGEPGFGWMPGAETFTDSLDANTIEQLDALLNLPESTDERAAMRSMGFTEDEITETLGPDAAASAGTNQVPESAPAASESAPASREAAPPAAEVTKTGDDRARDAELFRKTKSRLIAAFTGKSGESFDDLSKTLTARANDKNDPQSKLAAEVLDNFDGWKGNYEQRQAFEKNRESANPNEAAAKALESAAAALREVGKPSTKPADNDFLSELFGQPSSQPAEPQQQQKSGQRGIAAIRAAIRSAIDSAIRERDDWSSRNYKANKKQVELRGDGPGNNAAMSVGSINESRRNKAIESLNQEIAALGKLEKQVSSDSGATQVMAGMSEIMETAKRSYESGNYPGRTVNDLFESILLDRLKFRGPGGKGSVTSNGLSKAALSAITEQTRPTLDLTNPTESKLRTDDAKQKRDAAEKAAKENAPPPEEFGLVGSNRAADVGAAAGQKDLLAEKPAEKRKTDKTTAVYEALLKKKSTRLLKDHGNGRILYDVTITPEFRNANFVHGRMPRADGFELRDKADITGNPFDKGYVLIDNREQLRARGEPLFSRANGKNAGMPAFDNASGNYNPDLPKFWIEKAKKEINGEGMSDAEYHTAVVEYANRWRVGELLETNGWKARGSSNISPSTYFTKEVGIGEYDKEYKTYDEYKTYEIRVSDHNDFHKPSDADGIEQRFQVNYKTDRADWSDADISPSDTNETARTKLDGLLPNEQPASQGNDAAFSRSDTIEVDGKQRSRTNSDGQPLATTESGIRNFWRWFGDSKTVNYEGKPTVLYHGTTGDFTKFDRSFSNPESDLGSGFYFTNNIEDVGNNYAGLGPDLTNKVQRYAEQLESNEDMEPDEALKAARERFMRNDGVSMPSYVAIKNPVVIGGSEPTFFDYKEEYNEELDEYAEPTGGVADFVEALRQTDTDRYGDADIEQTISDIFAGLDGETDVTAERLIEITKASEGIQFATDYESDNGDLASNEIIRQAFARMGHDGYIDNTVNQKFGSEIKRGKAMAGMDEDTVHYIAFEPNQIKSALGNTGQFSPDNADIRYSREAPLWRSTLTEAIGKTSFAQAPADQWKAWLNANAAKLGVKKDEIEWSGVTDWLDLQKGKVTRDQVREFLDANGVKVTETMLADGEYEPTFVEQDDDGMWRVYGERANEGDVYDTAEQANAKSEEYNADIPAGPSKYSNYQLPGGTNYRELLLTLPKSVPTQEFRSIAQMKDFLQNNPRADLDGMSDLDKFKAINKERRKAGDQQKDFQSSHWDQPNILAHIRFNERTDADGKRVLFIEEIQSDWGQEGKKKGFARSKEAIQIEFDKVRQQYLDTPRSSPSFAAIEQRMGELRNENGNGTPSAPFVGKTEAWVSLALKRMIRYGVDNGFDRIAMVNGEQSAERYSLSKQVSRLDYEPSTQTLDAYGMDGKLTMSKDVTPEQLPDVIGKEAAERLLARPVNEGRKGTRQSLSGLDLQFGGEGMKAFYDRIVPQVANDVLKKLGGGKVGTIEIGKGGWDVYRTDERTDEPEIVRANVKTEALANDIASDYLGGHVKRAQGQQPGFDITDKMREQAAQGMPLFRRDEQQPATTNTHAADVIAKAAKTVNIPLDVYATPQEASAKLGIYIPSDVRGLHYRGRAALISSNITTRAMGEFVLWHELFHAGITLVAPRYSNEYNRIMQDMAARNSNIIKAARDWRNSYGAETIKRSMDAGLSQEQAEKRMRLMAIEEAIADLAGANIELKGWTQFVAKLQALLRSMRIFDNLANWIEGKSNAEVLQLIARTRDEVTTQNLHLTTQVPAFARDEDDASYQRAYHGTPHKFDKFSLDKIGTGEGAQAYGYGLYFASKREIADYYRNALTAPKINSVKLNGRKVDAGTPLYYAVIKAVESGGAGTKENVLARLYDRANAYRELPDAYMRQAANVLGLREVENAIKKLEASGSFVVDMPERNPGALYQVDIPEDSEMLHWDKPLSEQSDEVKALANKYDYPLSRTGGDFQKWASSASGGLTINIRGPKDRAGLEKQASDLFKKNGIRGIKYLDGGSRNAGDGSYNYVVFDDKDVSIEAVHSRTDTIEVDGKARARNNSNGKPIATTDEGLRNFWRWFGDSKAVDVYGKPLVVYHGAPDARFANQDGTFKTLGERYGGIEPDKRAFWFSKDRRTAATYADDRRAFDYQNAEAGIVDAYIRLENPLIVDANGDYWRTAQRRGKTSDVIAEARAAGNDGAIVRDVKDEYNNIKGTASTTTYTVFSSNQIKSATGNTGAFSPDNADIRFSRNEQTTPQDGDVAKTLPEVTALLKRLSVLESLRACI